MNTTGQTLLALYKNGHMLSRTQSVKGCLEWVLLFAYSDCGMWFVLFCFVHLSWIKLQGDPAVSDWLGMTQNELKLPLSRYPIRETSIHSWFLTVVVLMIDDVLMNATCTIFDDDSIWHL